MPVYTPACSSKHHIPPKRPGVSVPPCSHVEKIKPGRAVSPSHPSHNNIPWRSGRSIMKASHNQHTQIYSYTHGYISDVLVCSCCWSPYLFIPVPLFIAADAVATARLASGQQHQSCVVDIAKNGSLAFFLVSYSSSSLSVCHSLFAVDYFDATRCYARFHSKWTKSFFSFNPTICFIYEQLWRSESP